MFRAVPLSIISSFSLHTAMVYVIQLAHKLSANLYDIYHCCVYSKNLLMMDRGTVRNMQFFYSKNKFEKLVLLVGFIIRIKVWYSNWDTCFITKYFLFSKLHVCNLMWWFWIKISTQFLLWNHILAASGRSLKATVGPCFPLWNCQYWLNR